MSRAQHVPAGLISVMITRGRARMKENAFERKFFSSADTSCLIRYVAATCKQWETGLGMWSR